VFSDCLDLIVKSEFRNSKEVIISKKRVIRGAAAQKIGLMFIIPSFLTFIINAFPSVLLRVILTLICLAGYAAAIVSVFYYVFFYKPPKE